jgi:hypothetical protein
MTEENKLALVLTENKLDPVETQEEQKVFSPFFDQVEKLKKVCTSIVITDVSQVEEMEKAREYRLQLKKLRCKAEEEKGRLKEVPLRKCQAIDALARYLKSEIVPLEDHLKQQEDYVVKKEEERLDAVEAKRKAELDEVEADYQFIDIRKLPEENYQVYLKNAKETYELKQEKVKKEAEEAEKKAKEEEKAREEIRKENERLKSEADKKDKALEAERKKAQEAKDKAQAEADKKIAAEKAKADELAAQLKAKNDEDERKRKADEAKLKADEEAKVKAEKEAALAPDRKKLELLAVAVTQLQMPEVKSPEAKKIVAAVVELLNRTSNYIKEKTINL